MERYFPAKKIVLTGNPVRKQLLQIEGTRQLGLKEFGIEEDKKVFLVLGGSLGARTINRSIMMGLEKLERDDLQLLWQCGTHYLAEAEEAIRQSGVRNVTVMPFIAKMEWAYGVADLIVARAGAITISELCLIGKPAILVPSPNVAEDHQTQNARALVASGAALMVPDNKAQEEMVDLMLELMTDEEQKRHLSMNIKQLGIANASERIAAEVLKLVN
jgi:UDP-N-acetylglucosamine--N-acetylmuramyl-(pentapeptide) pyrophosphoryl-undecaprenol N-acetylglucosamine transferase